MRLAHGLGERDGRLATRVRELRPHEVHAGIGVGAPAPDGLVETAADRAVRVRSGDDHEVAIEPVAGVDRGPKLPDRLLATHDRLAGDVSAPLRESLILQVDARDASLADLTDRRA